MFGCGWGKYKEINSETSKCFNFSSQKTKQLQDYDSDKLCEQAELEMEICVRNLHLSMCVKTILFANYQKILYQLNLAKEKKTYYVFKCNKDDKILFGLVCHKGPMTICSFFINTSM